MSKSGPPFVELTCDGCGATFKRLLRENKKRIKAGASKFFCSASCRSVKVELKTECARCGTVTNNPKFCSRSCAAAINGSLFPKRVKQRVPRTCSVCGAIYYHSKNHTAPKRCQACIELWRSGKVLKGYTLEFVVNADYVKGKHPCWRHAYVRLLNRQWNIELTEIPCEKCGYSVHVELAHIKSVASFPLSATLGEVNDPENNVQLCRNCHWELDHGIFHLESLPRFQIIGAPGESRTPV